MTAEIAGLAMLAAVGAVMLLTGLPAFVALIAVALLFGVGGVLAGVVPGALLTALPYRLVGLLENDLLQALPLYVLMGALLERLPLAGRLFGVLHAATGRPAVAGVALGALLGPMNGSVGAAVATLMRGVLPRLRGGGMGAADGLALVAAAGTFGVIVPPSLVLILFGDAMMRAHTEALNATGRMDRIINTQDVFHGALPAAGLVALGCLLVAAWRGGRVVAARPKWGDVLSALLAVALIGGLLAAVAAGRFYAVEAAATGAVALFGYGLATGHLRGDGLRALLDEAMSLTGALFALFVGATSFSLVFRAFGTDRLLSGLIQSAPGGAAGALALVLLLLGLAALVLDAFEMIVVLVPVLMPPLLARAPDAVWVSVAALLALQASFLVPPVGYAVMMARGRAAEGAEGLGRALRPYLAVLALVLGLVLAWPGLTHLVAGRPELPPARPASEGASMLNQMLSPPADE